MTSRRTFFKQGIGGAVLLPLSATAGCSATSRSTAQQPRVRRSITELSTDERQEYVDGVLALKDTRSPFDPSLSYYDQFVAFHREAVRHSRVDLGYAVAHETPAFLPWHRKMILLLENAIRSVGFPDFTLPYWEWTDPEAEEVIFRNDCLGPLVGDPDDDYAVTEGPFRKGQFPLNITPLPIGNIDDESQAPLTSPFTFLTRGPKTIEMPAAEEVDNLMALTRYSAPPYDNSVDYAESFNNTLLGLPNRPDMEMFLHSAVHVYVGGSWEGTHADVEWNEQDITYYGSMAVLDASPNDPAFFLLHSNVDRLWAEWEAVHGTLYEPESGYNRYYNVDDEFYPFHKFADNEVMADQGLTPRSMLDIEPLGFTYDTLVG